MELTTLWKNLILFIVGGLFALHVQAVKADDSNPGAPTIGDDESCVIREDGYGRRI